MLRLLFLVVTALSSLQLQDSNKERLVEEIARLEQGIPKSNEGTPLISFVQLDEGCRLATCYYKIGSTEKLTQVLNGVRDLAKALDKSGDKKGAMLVKVALGKTLSMDVGKVKEGINLLKSVVQEAPETPDAAFSLAHAYTTNRDFEKATEVAEADLARVSAKFQADSFEYAWACQSLAESLVWSKSEVDQKRALEFFAKAAVWADQPSQKSNGNASRIRFFYGFFLLHNNKIKQALPYLDDVLAESNLKRLPTKERANLAEFVAAARLSEGLTKEGAAAYRQYAMLLESQMNEQGSTSLFDRSEVARALFEAGDFQKAIDMDLSIVNDESIKPYGSLWNESQIRRTTCLFQLDRKPEAKKIVEVIMVPDNLATLKPGHLGLIKYVHGRILLSDGDLKSGRIELTDALELLVRNQRKLWTYPHNHVLREVADQVIDALEQEGDLEAAAKMKERSAKFR